MSCCHFTTNVSVLATLSLKPVAFRGSSEVFGPSGFGQVFHLDSCFNFQLCSSSVSWLESFGRRMPREILTKPIMVSHEGQLKHHDNLDLESQRLPKNMCSGKLHDTLER